MLEDFAQGIKNQAGTVLTPDAGRIGGVTMLARTGPGKEAKLKGGSGGAGWSSFICWLSHGRSPDAMKCCG